MWNIYDILSVGPTILLSSGNLYNQWIIVFEFFCLTSCIGYQWYRYIIQRISVHGWRIWYHTNVNKVRHFESAVGFSGIHFRGCFWSATPFIFAFIYLNKSVYNNVMCGYMMSFDFFIEPWGVSIYDFHRDFNIFTNRYIRSVEF